MQDMFLDGDKDYRYLLGICTVRVVLLPEKVNVWKLERLECLKTGLECQWIEKAMTLKHRWG